MAMNTVGVVGLGYVGLTMAVTLARKGFTVHGVDTSPAVLDALAQGRPHLYEPGLDEGLGTFLGDRLHVASSLPARGVEAAIICVSTPVNPETRGPELGNLRAAARHVAERCAPDTLVIVRSTVPVGGSRAAVLPELLSAWGRARLAFAPERTIQGQALRELEELPQVVGGLDLESGRAAAKLFERVTRRVVSVSSLEAAELVKLANNCHTDLIYSYGNEIALVAERWGLDPLEVIRAANLDYPRPDLAKPGFVGGACLSKDPYILISASRATGYTPWLVGQARGLNEHLPGHVAERLVAMIRSARGSADEHYGRCAFARHRTVRTSIVGRAPAAHVGASGDAALGQVGHRLRIEQRVVGDDQRRIDGARLERTPRRAKRFGSGDRPGKGRAVAADTKVDGEQGVHVVGKVLQHPERMQLRKTPIPRPRTVVPLI